MAARIGLLAALAGLVFGLAPAVASAAPVWDVKTRWAATELRPGTGSADPGDPGDGEFVIAVRNYGDSASSGTVTVVQELPPGVVRIPPTEFDAFFELNEGYGWTCVGATTVTCTRTDPVPPFDLSSPRSPAWPTGGGRKGGPGIAPLIHLRVAVAPQAAGPASHRVTVSGGGAAADAQDSDQLTIGNGSAGFGVTPGSFASDIFDAAYPDGNRVRQAGSHPYELRVDFDMNLDASEEASPAPGLISPFAYSFTEGNLRTVEQTLPTGLIGNPEATPKCRSRDFQGVGASQYTSTECPPETQVGVMDLELNGLNNETTNHGFGLLFSHATATRIPVYNLEPPRGVPADFGFRVGDYAGHIYPTLDPASGYAIKATVPDVSSILPVRAANFTMWGVPADPAHDALRALPKNRGGTLELAYGASSGAPIRPLLTLPSSCRDHGGFKQRIDSWQKPDVWEPTLESQPSLAVTGCADPRIRFKPDVSLQPTSRAAGGPTGLRVNLEVPQRDQTVDDAAMLYEQNGNVHGVDTPPLKKAVVTLPEGMTISTSAAQGLGNCSLDQIRLGTNAPVTCPANSQYGTLTLRTPILPKDEPMTGRIYVAKQNENPFKNFLSLYLVIEEPVRGLLVKIPGRVDLDPVTGQITTSFDDLPQFPVSDMEMSLKGGIRAALVNPSTCGPKTITATFYSWHDPHTPITRSSSYDVTNKADGSPCVGHLGARPFAPRLQAGTVSPAAGSYSPFMLRLERGDGDQEFSSLGVTLPPGLSAKIAGLSKCPDAAIAAASAPGRTGTMERLAPSCPVSSEIGGVDVGTGVGQALTYVSGRAYLAGPYAGGPLSLVVITPVVAGPYDLGVIAVRSAIQVDSKTTQLRVHSDPFPQIFKGIPVRIRDIRVKIDRPRTTINPTSCEAMSIAALVTGAGGSIHWAGDDIAAPLSNRFQAADCGSLRFKPRLNMRLKGKVRRGGYPQLTATLKARRGHANIDRVAVALPRSEFLAQEHIRTVCTRVQFAARKCPKGSIYGRARAFTPLLDQPLEGPVYLRSSDNPLPDLVASLRGEVEVELVGRIDSVNQGIRTTFDVVPDAPVSKFVLKMFGGRKGLLSNSRNICRHTYRANARFTGQNGKRAVLRPKMKASCGKGKRAKRRAHRR